MAVWDNIIQAVKVEGVDGTATGSTEIFESPPNGENFQALFVQFIGTDLQAVTIPATVSVGVAPNYDTILGATLLTGFGAGAGGNGIIRTDLAKTDAVAVPQTASVRVRVQTAATATAFEFRVVLFGYYDTPTQ